MGCTPSMYRIFLVCCNVALLFVGLSVFVLGLKMKFALTVLMLINIPFIMKAVNAVVATGFFIALTGSTGICGACYESLLLLVIHLFGLGSIVVMEFSLGVTLMIVKKTIENAIDSVNCNTVCESTLNALVLDYALPSAGLMMTIIVVEALMIYSSIRLYFHIRDRPKIAPAAGGTSVVIQNVQMQNVATMRCRTARFRTTLKVLVIVACLLGFLVQISKYMLLYWTYPTVIDIQESMPLEMELPGISFCNTNAIKSNAICAMRGFCIPFYIIKYINVCKHFPEACIDGVPPKTLAIVSYSKITTSDNLNASLIEQMREPMSKFFRCKIISSGVTQECESQDAVLGSYYSDNTVFNYCYTINTLWGQPGKKIRKIKKSDKIILKFLVDASAADKNLSPTSTNPPLFNRPAYSAIQLVIHSPLISLSPYLYGFDFLAGKNYVVSLKKTEKHLLPAPYQTNCTNYMPLWVERGGFGALNEMMMVEECKFNLSLQEMGCVPFSVDYPHNETICEYCSDCSQITDIAEKCAHLLKSYNQPCDFVSYEMKVKEQMVYDEKRLVNPSNGINESIILMSKQVSSCEHRAHL